jgi:hypothetical protein
MTDKTDWEKAASAEGVTASERALARLAKKAFLSLWSYPNLYTDRGRVNGKGDGKEFCDLLVVFGNSVLLFSDKHCELKDQTPIEVSWPRWYKGAIEKSVRQLAGAERFAKSSPQRIFLDSSCKTHLPIALPDPDQARYFLIAVTRGSHAAARRFFGGGSSGSLMIDTSISGPSHLGAPFRVGMPLPGRFVHVLDDVTVDLLLEELDTVPDLVSYLECKEQFLAHPGPVMVSGEEDLLARYMTTMRDGRHTLDEIPEGTGGIAILEGDWAAYVSSPQRAAKRAAGQISYMWDELIEYQSSFIRAGTAISHPEGPNNPANHERIVRALAEQNRLARRGLAEHLRFALLRSDPGKMFSRVIMTGQPPSQVFVFLTIPRPDDMDYATYRSNRTEVLTVYCHAVKERMPTLVEAIGIASEPASEDVASQDFMYVDLSGDMSPEESRMWREAADELEILRKDTKVQLIRGRDHEFPLAFDFEGAGDDVGASAGPLNRAERRRLAAVARRKKRRR